MKNIPSEATLQEALGIRREIDGLEARLGSLFSSPTPTTRRVAASRRMPTARRAAAMPAPMRKAGGRKRKVKMTAEGRKRLSDAMKKRWANARRAGRAAL